MAWGYDFWNVESYKYLTLFESHLIHFSNYIKKYKLSISTKFNVFNPFRVFGELSQVEISVSDEVSALKAAYVEAAGEIEANARTFSKYSQRGNIS